MRVGNIFLVLPNKCNMRCSYCFTKDIYTKEEFSSDYMNRLEKILETLDLSNNVTIEFGASEPTLYYKEIKMNPPTKLIKV